ncbi:MAG: PVC-type heme-binding CxxCH protein, partial [Gemmataceae bacterium]
LLPLLLIPCSLLLTPPAFAQRDAKIPDPDPELERKTFVLPDGFEVNLWAADPLLAKPIQMNFDSRGRLWVAASEVYPQIKPGQKADDKILILEDTNGDGKADKTTVFADGLLIPTAVEPDQLGGCFAADSTDLVHFSAPDKNGKATKKRIVLSGFGTEDTHHILHTFRTGPDCNLYMSQSIYIHSHIETPHGVRRLNAGGIWQFRPETERLEVFARGWVNSWGTAWNKWGATFATDGAGGEGINYVVPGAAYTTARDVARILPGLNPGSPKYCGLEVVSGRHLPDDWQQNLITNDFRGHRVCRYVVQEDGSGFAAKEQKELIRSTHPAFRPIYVKMGPDGAIYIADWYNPIIQHGEVDFRDERRDKTHGRIWRITAKGRPLVPKPKISGATVDELLELLKAPEDWTRSHAKRELKARGEKEVLPALEKWTEKQKGGPLALEALWVYQALAVQNRVLHIALLQAKDWDIRAAACRVAGDTPALNTGVWKLLTQLTNDSHPRVRLEAVRAHAKLKTDTTILATALDQPTDRWLDYAIWLSLRETKDQWLPKVKDGTFDFGGDPKKLVFALQAAGEGDVSRPLRALVRRAGITPAQRTDALVALARLGNSDDLGFVLVDLEERINSPTIDAEAGVVLPVMEAAVRARKLPPPPTRDGFPWAGSLDDCTHNDPGPARQAALRLMGLWKQERSLLAFEKGFVRRKMASDEDVRAMYDGLALAGGEASSALVRQVAADAASPHRRLAVTALLTLDAPTAAQSAADILTGEKTAPDAEPLFAAFVGRKGGATELAKALADTKLSADVAKVGVRVARTSAAPDQKLIDALTKAGGLAAPKRALTKAELDQMVADVKAKGDPARGELVYRRAEMNCLKCHGVAGAGGQVGPDMTSIGASAQIDYLIESLLNPNAKIKEGYNSFLVNTDDGRSFSGIKVRETNAEIVFRDAEDKEITVRKADRPEVKPGKSLMPEGLTDPLTNQEFLDLVRFLSELGKGPYLAQPGKVVRRWQAVLPVQPLFTVVTRDRVGAVATAKDLQWAAAYSRVSGDLPVEDLPKWKIGQGEFQAVARFDLDCTTAGKAKLVFGDTTGLQLWLDGTPLEAGKEVTVDLSAGLHTVTVHVKLDQRKAPLRAELAEVDGSPARVRIVGGK